MWAYEQSIMRSPWFMSHANLNEMHLKLFHFKKYLNAIIATAFQESSQMYLKVLVHIYFNVIFTYETFLLKHVKRLLKSKLPHLTTES